MAGFLDKNTRIIDMVLTNHGKKLLAKGELNFTYWIPFDDEIDYDPYIAESGSISEAQLSSSIYLSIENSPVREATTGYRNFNLSGSDYTNVHRPMFTKPQGQEVLPRSLFPVSSSRSIETKQRRVQRVYKDRDEKGKYLNPIEPVDVGVERFASSNFSIEIGYEKNSFPGDFQPEGFHIRIMQSGSEGLVEIPSKRDMNNDLSYNNDVRVFVIKKTE